MTDQELISLIKQLDGAVPKDGAVVRGRAVGETVVYANKEGYLRLGIELMKCAFKETNDKSGVAHLFSDDSDFCLDHLTTTEDEFRFYGE